MRSRTWVPPFHLGVGDKQRGSAGHSDFEPVIAVLIPVAAFGWLGLGAVVAVHELAEILVIANGLRARRSLHHRTATAEATVAAAFGLRSRPDQSQSRRLNTT